MLSGAGEGVSGSAREGSLVSNLLKKLSIKKMQEGEYKLGDTGETLQLVQSLHCQSKDATTCHHTNIYTTVELKIGIFFGIFLY